ncbi:MAG: Ig-like domain-containing protein, partial [Myxococcaceae bacterium]
VNDAVLSVKERSGLESTRGIPIEVPPYNRLTAALVPHALIADGHSYARLLVLYDLGGADLPPDRVKLTASLGHPVFERAERGRYVYRYSPPAGTPENTVRFDVSVEGDPVARGSMQLTLGLPPPARVLVRAPGKPLPCDGLSAAPVTALVFDAAGLGLPAQTVELFADGKALPPARYLGNGLYEASYTAPSTYPPGGLVQFLARTFDTSRGAITSSANYQLRPAPMPSAVSASLFPDPVPADGHTSAILALDVRDAAGFPLDGASLILVASHGALGPLQARGAGRYEASYTGPAAIPESGAFVRVVDSTGAFEARLGLPLRENPHRVLAGVRAGATHTLGDVLGARVGLDLYAPLRLRNATLGLGLTASYGSLTQLVTDGKGELTSRSRAVFLPVTLRLGYELYAGRQLSVQAGAGAVLTLARFGTSFNGAQANGVGGGGLGFLALGWALGPGQVFAELSYVAAPVETSAFRLESGGLGLEVGFRLGVL